MLSGASVILSGIKDISGYRSLPGDTKDLINNVINNFLLKKFSAKVASRRISALFGNDEKNDSVYAVFMSFTTGIPLKEYIQNFLPSKQMKKGIWSSNEDLKLIEAVNTIGTSNWAAVSEYIGNGRSKAQCAQRWERTLDPSISRDVWTQEENDRLVDGIKKYGFKSWVKISKLVGTRSDVQCRYRYYTVLNGKTKKGMSQKAEQLKENPVTEITEKPDNLKKKEDRFSFFDKLELNDDIISMISF